MRHSFWNVSFVQAVEWGERRERRVFLDLTVKPILSRKWESIKAFVALQVMRRVRRSVSVRCENISSRT